jgi:DNA-directed RNA polymerase subunit RPC12/RpoP
VQVVCPQCGASIEALTESRFYVCPYCTSSFIFHEGKGLAEYTIRHARNDREAWSALTSYLETWGYSGSFERLKADYRPFPFWLAAMQDGVNRLFPAEEHPFPEIAIVTLPAGDLVFLEPGDEYPAPRYTPKEAAANLPEDNRPLSWSLNYLPLYFLSYQVAEQTHHAIVSGADGKVFALDRPAPSGVRISLQNLAMMAVYALVLAVEGFLIGNHALRAGVFIATSIAAYGLYSSLLRKEASR